jgi:hypothetical protein
VEKLPLFTAIGDKTVFVKADREQWDMQIAALIGYLSGKSAPKDEIYILCETGLSIRQMEDVLPGFAKKHKDISGKKAAGSKRTRTEPVRRRKTTEEVAHRKKSSQEKADEDDNAPLPGQIDIMEFLGEVEQEKPETSIKKKTTKSRARTRVRKETETFEDLVRTHIDRSDLDCPLDKTMIEGIRKAVENAAEKISFELQLQMHLGYEEGKRIYPVLVESFSKLKKLI